MGRSFLVKELSICAFNSKSAHHLIHLVYGPVAKRGLREHLGIDFGWSESNTHIEMLQQTPITQVASNTQTDDEIVLRDHDNEAEDSSGVNENDMIAVASSLMDATNSVDGMDMDAVEDDAAATQDRNNTSSLTDANNDDDMDVDDVKDIALVDEVGCNGPDEDEEDEAVGNLMDSSRNEQEYSDGEKQKYRARSLHYIESCRECKNARQRQYILLEAEITSFV